MAPSSPAGWARQPAHTPMCEQEQKSGAWTRDSRCPCLRWGLAV